MDYTSLLYSLLYQLYDPQNTPHSLSKKAQCHKTKLKWKLGQHCKEDAVQYFVCLYLYLLVYNIQHPGSMMRAVKQAPVTLLVLLHTNFQPKIVNLKKRLCYY